MDFIRRRVAIVDGDRILLDSYAHIINNSSKYIAIGTYTTAEAVFAEIIRRKIEIIIMDISLLGDIDGIAATEKIRAKYPHVEVIINTCNEEREFVRRSFKAGAIGYILKNDNVHQIVEALNILSGGGSPLDSKIARGLVSQFHINANSPLSKREREVLTLMSTGKTYSQLADILFVSPKTARTHIRNIYSKLQVSNKSEAIKVATDNHFV
ncbi:MAG: response regulator transcription factor [Cyclobacteriaceae bacterium]